MIWNDDTEETTGIIREEKYGRLNIEYVDIVRCKDCRYFNYYFVECEKNNHTHGAAWFCADGERK